MFLWGFKVEKLEDTEEKDNLETLKKLSYKRKGMEKTYQGFEDAYTKVNSNANQVVTTPKTPGFVEEISIVESMETAGVLEPKSPEIKKTYSRIKKYRSC